MASIILRLAALTADKRLKNCSGTVNTTSKTYTYSSVRSAVSTGFVMCILYDPSLVPYVAIVDNLDISCSTCG